MSKKIERKKLVCNKCKQEVGFKNHNLKRHQKRHPNCDSINTDIES